MKMGEERRRRQQAVDRGRRTADSGRRSLGSVNGQERDKRRNGGGTGQNSADYRRIEWDWLRIEFVLSLSEALHEELRGTGFRVTALCPGVTRTGFQARANVEKTRYVRSGSMTAQRVAGSGYAALKRGTPVVVPGWRNWLLTFSIRFVPRSLSASMAKRMLEPVGH